MFRRRFISLVAALSLHGAAAWLLAPASAAIHARAARPAPELVWLEAAPEGPSAAAGSAEPQLASIPGALPAPGPGAGAPPALRAPARRRTTPAAPPLAEPKRSPEPPRSRAPEPPRLAGIVPHERSAALAGDPEPAAPAAVPSHAAFPPPRGAAHQAAGGPPAAARGNAVGSGQGGGARWSGAGAGGAGVVPRSPAASPPHLVQGHHCADLFPHAARSDSGVVEVALRVAVSGQPVASQIVDEAPRGQGFALAARHCVRRLRFAPALDDSGHAVASRSVIRLRFERHLPPQGPSRAAQASAPRNAAAPMARFW